MRTNRDDPRSAVPTPAMRSVRPPPVTRTSTGGPAARSSLNASPEGPRSRLTWPETGPFARRVPAMSVAAGALIVPVTSDGPGNGPLTVSSTTAPATTMPAMRAA